MATTTQDITDAAQKLGRLLAEHDTATKLETAYQKLREDTAAQKAMAEYQRHIAFVAQKESGGQPVEVADKRKLQELEQAVIHNLALRELQRAQMDYVDLVRQVDEQLTSAAGEGAATTLGRSRGR